jgi:hypothetical protein
MPWAIGSGNLSSQRDAEDDQRLLPISLPDLHVTVVEPVIKLGKSGGTAVHLDRRVGAEERDADVGAGIV